MHRRKDAASLVHACRLCPRSTFSECGRAAIAAQTSKFRGRGGATLQISGTGRRKPANFRDRAAQTSKFRGPGGANQQFSPTAALLSIRALIEHNETDNPFDSYKICKTQSSLFCLVGCHQGARSATARWRSYKCML